MVGMAGSEPDHRPDRPPDMSGKVCLITGATAGIGRLAARDLAAMGATVIVGGRDRRKAEATVDWIRGETGTPAVEYLLADLSSQREIHRMADRFKERYCVLHALVNNAGGFFAGRRETEDGIELTFALNHLAPFLLTHLLLEALRRGAPSRIINVSSRAHWSARGMDFGDLESRRRYSGWRAYSRSKLAVLLFSYELARRLEDTGVTVNALHPGFVATGFSRDAAGPLKPLLSLMERLLAVSPEEGARTIVRLAASPEVEGITGRYFVGGRAAPSSPGSYDQESARRLWEESARMAHLPVTA